MTVAHVRTIEAKGPWQSKSGGELMVYFTLPRDALSQFLQYDQEELEGPSKDIRGLRCYTIRDIPRGGKGGGEFHKLRQEIVFALQGSLYWTCEDLAGGRWIFQITPDLGIWMPPFILHSYYAETDSGLIVFANTLYDVDDSSTHDSYSLKDFQRLQALEKI